MTATLPDRSAQSAAESRRTRSIAQRAHRTQLRGTEVSMGMYREASFECGTVCPTGFTDQFHSFGKRLQLKLCLMKYESDRPPTKLTIEVAKMASWRGTCARLRQTICRRAPGLRQV